MGFDLLITNATVVDGTGGEPFLGGAAVAAGRIAAVWRAGAPDAPRADNAAEVVDAAGRLLTPGFVDVHSHSDFNILIEPGGHSKIFQGITTEIVGNCGMSAFPLDATMRAEEWEIRPRRGLDPDWDTAGGYMERLEAARPAFNVASFVGHGNVRGVAMGFADRPAGPDEMRAMERLVDEAMDAGALGMSTGLIYAPGMFAGTDEIVALQRAAARRGGIYASHVRGEGDSLVRASAEFFDVVGSVGCQAQYSHLKASGRRNWGRVAGIVERIERENAAGARIRFDKYPYTASSTELATMLPRWARSGGQAEGVARLRDAATRARVVAEMREDFGEHEPWDGVLLVDAGNPAHAAWQGASFARIAEREGADPYDVFVEVLIGSRMGATISSFTMSQEETDAAILHPLGMVCSDGECRCTRGPLAEGIPHPRSFGAFGRFFREYVKERALLPLADAVAKVTALPCETFGFRERGLVRGGFHADLLLLDWERYRDRADFANPHQYCEGVDMVVVNGVVTVRDGALTGRRGGVPLRRA